MRIGINGMGRIGRLALRAAHQKGVEVAAVRDRNPVEHWWPLVQRDSIYGFTDVPKPVIIGQSHDKIMPVDVMLECAGGGPDGNKARRYYLPAIAKRVIISAPADNVDATLVMGVNEHTFDPAKHKIISMASCTTNCVAPILKVLDNAFTLGEVWMDSVNAYTNSQRIVDAPNSDPRRARAAALNIIPSESSTGKSVGIVLPRLQGRYSGRAYRVPVACGSVCSISAQIYRQKVTADDVNAVLEAAAKALPDIIEYSTEPLVSTDVIGNGHSAIVDSLLTEVRGNTVHVVAWYDNEYGFSCRLIDLAVYINGT